MKNIGCTASVWINAAAIAWAAAPAAPVHLVATGGTQVIGLNWADSAGAATYRVYQAPSAEGPWTLLATRDRSRHLVAQAPAGEAHYYRVTAVHAGGEESEPSSIVTATADNLTIDRAGKGGHYRIGSSFVVDSDRLKPLLESRGLFVSSYRRQIIGAGIEYIWSDTLNNRPSEHAQHVAVLQEASYDVLVMNAQSLWLQPTRELNGTLAWAEEGLAANPDYRVFLHQYWTREVPGYEWDETVEQPENSLRLFWLAAVRNAYLAGEQLGVPVFVAPFGEAIQEVKKAAETGLLQGYDSRDDLHPDGSHLTNFGKYAQEGVVLAGAYQRDIRGASRFVDNQTLLSENDAEVVQEIIHQTVRRTPFSGWHEGAAGTFAAHQQALLAAMNRWEDFTNFATNGSGSWVGRTGRTWTYDKAQTVGNGLERQIQLNAGGWVETTLEQGLLNALWRMRKEGSGTGQLTLFANGLAVGVVDYPGTDLWGRQVREIDLGGTVVLRLQNTGTSAVRIDDLMWDETGTTGDGVEIITQKVQPLLVHTPIELTLKAYGGTPPLIFTVTNGALPPGLVLTEDGRLTGNPQARGAYPVTITVTDSATPETSFAREYAIQVVAATVITVEPVSATVSFGETLVLSVGATGDELSYRWLHNGTPLADTNRAELVIPGAGPLNEGLYRVEVKGLGGTVLSEEVTVTVSSGEAFVLSTSMQDTNRDLSGNVFDLTNTGVSEIRMTGRMTGNFDAESGLVMSGWYRLGSAEGQYTSAEGWLPWGVSAPFTGNGYGTETPYDLQNVLTIAPGQTLGIYLFLTSKQNNLAYRAVGSTQTYARGDLLLTPKIGLGGGTAFGTAQIFGGPTARRAYSGSIEFTVDTLPVISSLSPAVGAVGQPYSHIFRRQGGNGLVTWTLKEGSVPPGLTLDLETQVLAGRPTEAGSFNFTLETVDADGDSDQQLFGLTIRSPFDLWLEDQGLPVDSDPASDPGRTGLPLLVRHALGQSATRPGWLVADQQQFILTRGLAATDVSLHVDICGDLQNWQEVYRWLPDQGEWVGESFVAGRETGEAWETMTLQFSSLSMGSARFVRVRVRTWPHQGQGLAGRSQFTPGGLTAD